MKNINNSKLKIIPLGGLEQIDAVRLLAEGEALDALGGVPLEQPIVPDTSLERD